MTQPHVQAFVSERRPEWVCSCYRAHGVSPSMEGARLQFDAHLAGLWPPTTPPWPVVDPVRRMVEAW